MGIELDKSDLDMARELALHQRTTLDKAVAAALRRDFVRQGLTVREELSADERQRRSEEFRALIKDIQDRIAELPVLDPRPYREILYDEDGLPK